ncbi:MAG TPA: hypothetical protein VFX51_19900 [Solirubrobacteraceae bacterium]|nr:hypothetical protein [Solirubrobacteraceae bacterium]
MRTVDRTSLVAGVVIVIAGVVLLLDRVDVLDLKFGYGGPLLIAVIGAILVAAGLEGPRDAE